MYQHSGVFDAGSWDWALDSKLKNLDLNSSKTLSFESIIVASPGESSRALDATFNSKTLIGTYTIGYQAIAV